MKRLMLILALALSACAAASAAAQEITGTVHDSDGKPIQGIAVLFLDARDGLLLGTATTTVSGEYTGGTIPTGNYRVRFLDEYGAGSPGFFIPEFSGAKGSDDFCSAAVVSVLPGATAIVDESMAYQGPTKFVPHAGSIAGQVTAAETGAPLPGIQVAVVDAANAWQIVSTKTQSDEEPGVYEALISQSSTPRVRIRFPPPRGTIFPSSTVPAAQTTFAQRRVWNMNRTSKGSTRP